MKLDWLGGRAIGKLWRPSKLALGGFLAYTVSRLAIWSFYSFYLYVACLGSRIHEAMLKQMKVRRLRPRANTAGVYVHLHHYIIGFLCAILAEFNHPISLLVLAGGTGIFVQGISDTWPGTPSVGVQGEILA